MRIKPNNHRKLRRSIPEGNCRVVSGNSADSNCAASSPSPSHDKGSSRPALLINLDAQPCENCNGLGAALSSLNALYRNPVYRGGLLIEDGGRCHDIRTAKQLAPFIADHLDVEVLKKGKLAGCVIPAAYLGLMLETETFLKFFKPVDAVTAVPGFTREFKLLQPGYNPGPSGSRIFFIGPAMEPAKSIDTIQRFLDVMDFASEADRTAAVAMALTVLLRYHWPGGKPMLLTQATKSHSGKDTVLDFSCGMTPSYELSFQHDRDWPMEKNVAGVLAKNPDIGVVRYGNVRLDRKKAQICSIYIERFITSDLLWLYTTNTGKPEPIYNSHVVAMSTNEGSLSEDLNNRSLRSMLSPKGNVADRVSPVGDPRWEFLPQNRLAIHAELLGIVARFEEAGRPLDTNVKHTFKAWSQHIGGMLSLAGFKDFLANHAEQRVANDPVRDLLAFLGLKSPGEWLRPKRWLEIAESQEIADDLIPAGHQQCAERRRDGLGMVLSRHEGETFTTATEDEVITLRLSRDRRRLKPGADAKVVYRFDIVERKPALDR